jgi:solute carrier family 45 protein 1/2/4
VLNNVFAVAVIAGTILPHLANRDRRLMAHKEDVDEDAEMTRLKNTVRQWRAEAARKGKPLRLPMTPFLLRNIWTGALLWFTLLTFSTFFITTVTQVKFNVYLRLLDAELYFRQAFSLLWLAFPGQWPCGHLSLSLWK